MGSRLVTRKGVGNRLVTHKGIWNTYGYGLLGGAGYSRSVIA